MIAGSTVADTVTAIRRTQKKPSAEQLCCSTPGWIRTAGTPRRGLGSVIRCLGVRDDRTNHVKTPESSNADSFAMPLHAQKKAERLQLQPSGLFTLAI